MKKLLYCAAALAMALFAGSCQKENLEPEGGNIVTYTVQVPDALSTKAIGTDVSAVTELVYEVYRIDHDNNDEEIRLYHKKQTRDAADANWTVELELVNNQDFRVLFWAQVPGNDVYNTDNLTAVTLSTNLNANAENYAAFAGQTEIKYNEGFADGNITLVRPVAQLNIATSAESLVLGEGGSVITNVTFDKTSVEVKGLSNVYNVAAEEAVADNDGSAYIYKATNPTSLSEDKITVNSKNYTYVSMNYVGFIPKVGDNVDVKYTIKTTNVGTITNEIKNVPVKANYRTNIIGNLITSTSDYTVTLDSDWKTDDVINEENVEVITNGLAKVLNTGEYLISTANGLAYASHNLFAKKGGSYVLTGDIDMSDATSVVTKTAETLTYNSASLTNNMAAGYFMFDGQGHTIKNLPGMFIAYTGSAKSVEVKNLTLDTPKVAFDVDDISRTNGVGAFIGYAGTTTTITLDNCHVKGGKIEGGHWTGGLVGYAAGYSGNDGPVFETLTIKECSVKDAIITGKGSCGGIIGHATGDDWTLVDMDDIVVSGNTVTSLNTDSDRAGSVMGTLGNAGQPKTVNGITKTGGVTIDAYYVNDNIVKSNNVENTKLWGRQGNSNGVLTIEGENVEDFGSYKPTTTTITVTDDDELTAAIKATIQESNVVIKLDNGTYNDILLTVAKQGNATGSIAFKAVEGAEPVIAGTVVLGYREQGVGSAMWNRDVTFEGITFDHAESAEHSIDVQDVKSLTLKGCTIVGDGECGLVSARGNATGTSLIENCTFENAAMQILGNFGTSLKINQCVFNESRINVQAGNGVTVQNCTFNNTLKEMHLGDSFYCIRSNSTPITVMDSEINIDSKLIEVASNQEKWGLLWNRGTTNWTVKNVSVTMTDAAKMQTSLLITKCDTSGTINEDLIVNGLHLGVSQNSEGVWVAETSDAFSWLKSNKPEIFENGKLQWGSAIYAYSDNGTKVNISVAGEEAKTVSGLVGSSVLNVTVSEGIKVIGDRTFRYAPNMEIITLPNSLITIENDAFQKAYALKEITIPENVTSIGTTCFGACSGLEKIVINAKSITFNNYCARACINLKEVFIYSDEIEFGTGSMYFTNKENADASAITFYVKNQEIAEKFYKGMSTSHSYGMKIVSLDGETIYYNTLK